MTLNIPCPTSRIRKQSVERLDKMRMRNRKITKLLMVVTSMFVVLWSPYVILRLIKHSGVKFDTRIWQSSQLFMLFTSTTNFFIYTIMSKEMRKVFWSVIRCRRIVGDISSESRYTARGDVLKVPRISFGIEDFQCNNT